MVDILCARAHRLWGPMVDRLKTLHGRGERLLVLVPEQYTLQAERDLMQALQVKGFFNLEVLSPSRLQYRVFEAYGADPRVLIDERGRAMAVARALQRVNKALTYYIGVQERPGFVRRMGGLLSVLKGIQLTPPDLEQAAAGMPGGNLKRKLQDSGLVLAAYEGLLAGQFCDQQDVQQDMLSRMERGGMFQGRHVFVYGFDVLTELLHSTLLLAAAQASSLTLTLVCEREEAPDGEAFSAVRQSLTRLRAALQQRNIRSRQLWFDDLPLDAPPDIRHLERQLLGIAQTAYPGSPEAIRLFAAPTPHREVQQVAQQLLLALQDGLAPQDALVLCGSLPSYRGLIVSAFEEWGIPCYVADKLPLASQPLCRYLLAALHCVADNWRDEDVKALISSGFSDLTQQEGWLLENYALAHGIRGSRWLSSFSRGEEALRLQAEALRQKLTVPLMVLHRGLVAASTAAQSLGAVADFLAISRVEEKAQALELALEAGGLAKEAIQSRQAWPLLQEMLSQMGALMGEERIPLKHFAFWLESGLAEEEIAALPPEGGMVQVGQLGNLLPHRPRQVFLLGLNEGILDAADDGLLSQEELSLAEESLGGSLGLSTGAKEELKLLDLWKALSAPRDKLYISYSLSNEEGGVLQPLLELGLIRQLFPQLIEEGGALAAEGDDQGLQPLAPAPALDSLALMLQQAEPLTADWQQAWAWLYQDARWGAAARGLMAQLGGEQLTHQLPTQLAEALFRAGSASISRLERFSGCPYQHFVKEGLKPQIWQTWTVEPIDTGNFYHAAMEGFTRLALADGQWPQVSDHQAEGMMDQAIAPLLSLWEDLPFHDSARSRHQAQAYIRLCRRMGWALTRTAQNADMRPLRAELRFGEGHELPPIRLQMENGQEVLLGGVIDRLDRFQSADADYLRIVDYKSRSHQLGAPELWGGLHLQLLIYLRAAMLAFPGAKPAGAYYQRLKDPLISTEDAVQVEGEVLKELRLQGITLDDPFAVRLMDREGPLSLSITFNKDGSLNRRSRLFSLEEIRLLSDHALHQAEDAASRIAAGEILRRPTRDRRGTSPCQYCDYAGICRIDKLNRPLYRQLENLSMNQLIARLRQQAED